MALVNHAKRQIHAKLVMFGPAGSGKKTSLSYIYRKLKPEFRGIMRTMNIQKDKMVFFDFFPGSRSENTGYEIRYHLYTLTGSDVAASSWKMLLKAADGIIFVADSDPEKLTDNRESAALLGELLAGVGLSLPGTPLVVQLNKRDSEGALPVDVLRAAVPAATGPVTTSVAVTGEGVVEALFTLMRGLQTQLGREGIDLIGETDQVVHELEPDKEVTSVPAEDTTSAPVAPPDKSSTEGNPETSFAVQLGGDVGPVPGGIRIPLLVRSGSSQKIVSVTLSLSIDTEQ